MHIVTRVFRIKKIRLPSSGSHVAGVVIGQRNSQIERCCPELVVLQRRITLAAGIAVELHAFHSEIDAVLQLFDCVIHAGGRQRAHTNQSIRRRRHVLLGEKLVIGADAIAIKIIVFGLTQHKGDL